MVGAGVVRRRDVGARFEIVIPLHGAERDVFDEAVLVQRRRPTELSEGLLFLASDTKTTAQTQRPDLRYVVETKLLAPRVKDGLLERPDLVQKLRAGKKRTLTLVCAPPDTGRRRFLPNGPHKTKRATPSRGSRSTRGTPTRRGCGAT